MTFRTEQFITRHMLRSQPKTLFVFGDNIKGTGRGGQAAAMRGEPNAVGIPTKWLPSMTDGAFFCDEDYSKVKAVIELRFQILVDHLNAGGDVVWPSHGIGTGRAELKIRSPAIYALIKKRCEMLEKIGKDDGTKKPDGNW